MLEAGYFNGGIGSSVISDGIPLKPKQFYECLGGTIGMNYIYECLNLNNECPEYIKHLRIGKKILIVPSELKDWPSRLAEQVKN